MILQQDEPTTVAIFRAQASELFVRFNSRKEAYFWAIKFSYLWGKNLQINMFEEKDSSSWGSPVANDEAFDINLYSGHGLYDRSIEWYETRDLGFHIVAEDYAIGMGLNCEPCKCEDPCMHEFPSYCKR
jgi:hypothetical protein